MSPSLEELALGYMLLRETTIKYKRDTDIIEATYARHSKAAEHIGFVKQQFDIAIQMLYRHHGGDIKRIYKAFCLLIRYNPEIETDLIVKDHP